MFQKLPMRLLSACLLSALVCGVPAQAEVILHAEVIPGLGEAHVLWQQLTDLGLTLSMQAYDKGKEGAAIIHDPHKDGFTVSTISFEFLKGEYPGTIKTTLDPILRLEVKEGDRFVYQQYTVHTDNYNTLVSSPTFTFNPPIHAKRAAVIAAGTGGVGIPRSGSTVALIRFVKFLINGTNPVGSNSMVDLTIKKPSEDPLLRVEP